MFYPLPDPCRYLKIKKEHSVHTFCDILHSRTRLVQVVLYYCIQDDADSATDCEANTSSTSEGVLFIDADEVGMDATSDDELPMSQVQPF